MDEYITFNRVVAKHHSGDYSLNGGDEPDFPVDEAPQGVSTLIDREYHQSSNIISGWIINQIHTDQLASQIGYVQPDELVTDISGHRFFLRDDGAARDFTALDLPPETMPILKYFYCKEVGMMMMMMMMVKIKFVGRFAMISMMRRMMRHGFALRLI